MCTYRQNCPHNKDFTCHGGMEFRENNFICDYVDAVGNFISDAGQRHPMDKTGKSQILMEQHGHR